jgi:hypothetical protein
VLALPFAPARVAAPATDGTLPPAWLPAHIGGQLQSPPEMFGADRYYLVIALTRIIHEALEPAALRRGGHAIFHGVGDAVVEV